MPGAGDTRRSTLGVRNDGSCGGVGRTKVMCCHFHLRHDCEKTRWLSIARGVNAYRYCSRRFVERVSRGKLAVVAGDALENVKWLTIPDLVDILHESQSRVRRLLEERHLVAIRRDGVLVVPESFIRDGHVLTELHGTVVVLSDLHFSDEEIVRWLLEVDDSLDAAPIDALRAGRKAEVRRVAMTLA